MKRRRQHNYLNKLLAMQARGALPTCGVSQLEIAHDDWCRIYLGGYCNCDPDIRVRPLLPRPVPPPSVN
jgi:hypothetical protein